MKGTQHEVVVESLANSGDGVGRIENRVVFIPHCCPDDKLLVEITLSKKTFLKAKIVKILSPSPQRVEAPCDHFGACGGCDWQHIPYSQQLYWKHQQLCQVLEKIGHLQNLQNIVTTPVPSPETYGYRNRIQLHSNGQSYYYNRKNSHHPVHINQCLIAHPEINDYLRSKDKILPKGKYEFAQTDQGVKTYKVSDKGLSELGFRQVNQPQNQFLVQKTLDFIKKQKIKTLFDLYCGQGNWSLALSHSIQDLTCIGIDIDPINIKEAKKEESKHVTFLQGAVEDLFPMQKQEAELVIVDPPRAGCDEGLWKSLKQKKVQFLIYVSCHPATLARDIKTLSSQGWTAEEICPVDMFPQTAHLETWCLLRSERHPTTANY